MSAPNAIDADTDAPEAKASVLKAWLKALSGRARRPLMLAAAAPLLSGVLLVFQAWILAWVLDAAIVRHVPKSQLLSAIVAIAALIALRATLIYVGERAGARAAERIKHAVRSALFTRLLAHGPQWTRMQTSGALASGVVEQVEALDGFFSKYLPAMVSAAVLPVAFAVVLLPIDLVVGLLLLITAPLIPLFMALIGLGAEAASRRHLRAFTRLSGFFADRLRGLATLKLYGRAQAEAASVVAASEALRERTMSVLRIAFLSSAVLEFFAALGVAGVAVYIGLSYLGFLDFRATPFSLQLGLFCLLMAPEVYAPLRQFAVHYHDRASARAAATQLETLFEGLPQVQASSADVPPSPATSLAHDRGAITVTVHDLSLHAPGRSTPVLNQTSFTVQAGQHIALMGASGIGKTSLLEALTRLRNVEGQIDLNGLPLAQWNESALRERVSLIGQRPYLFAGSIAANIRLAKPDATDDQVREAARRACVLEFTQDLPQGLDTVLGQGGRGISGGQAQRLAIARLFLRDPDLILLDEPTAHLDDATQGRVLDEILNFAQGRSLLLVTHSPAVAQRFSIVWRLADGKVERV